MPLFLFIPPNHLIPDMKEILKFIGEIAEELGLSAYVVGGYVRDEILGRNSYDIDILVVGKGVKLAEEVGKRTNSKVLVFKNFGTAQLIYQGQIIEFVGARKESYQRGSRKPIVEEGTLEDDLTRRDFTINAIAKSIMPRDFGTIIDLFGGQEDIKLGIIKSPTDPLITFSDDPLRMLRAIRFATTLGFKIDPTTFEAIKKTVDRLDIISPERITTELCKIMSSNDPGTGIDLLKESGLLKKIIPELDILDTSDSECGRGHKNNYWHSVQVLRGVADKSNSLWLRWAALLHDIGKEPTKKFIGGDEGWSFIGHEAIGADMAEVIFRRLKLPLGDTIKYVKKLINLHMRPAYISTSEITDSGVRRLLFDAGDDFDDLMILCRSDLTTKREDKRERIEKHYDQLQSLVSDLKERDQRRLFQPCINGNDIKERYGLRTGRLVGQLKNFIKEGVLDGRLENTRSCLFKALDEEWNRIKK